MVHGLSGVMTLEMVLGAPEHRLAAVAAVGYGHPNTGHRSSNVCLTPGSDVWQHGGADLVPEGIGQEPTFVGIGLQIFFGTCRSSDAIHSFEWTNVRDGSIVDS